MHVNSIAAAIFTADVTWHEIDIFHMEYVFVSILDKMTTVPAQATKIKWEKNRRKRIHKNGKKKMRCKSVANKSKIECGQKMFAFQLIIDSMLLLFLLTHTYTNANFSLAKWWNLCYLYCNLLTIILFNAPIFLSFITFANEKVKKNIERQHINFCFCFLLNIH